MDKYCVDYKTRYYSETENVPVRKNCNGFLAVNEGTTTVKVNGKILQPPPAPGLSGEGFGIFCNVGEIYVGNNGAIDIEFPILPVGGIFLVSISQKFYTNMVD
jgi:hypothetical protein